MPIIILITCKIFPDFNLDEDYARSAYCLLFETLFWPLILFVLYLDIINYLIRK